jgi:hypothetical protein
MRNALNALILFAGLAMLTACHKAQPPAAENQEMSIDDNLTGSSQVSSNADIETLPPDESSGTSSRELANGQDNPDVNDVGNGD